jgi:hypothetical protein
VSFGRPANWLSWHFSQPSIAPCDTLNLMSVRCHNVWREHQAWVRLIPIFRWLMSLEQLVHVNLNFLQQVSRGKDAARIHRSWLTPGSFSTPFARSLNRSFLQHKHWEKTRHPSIVLLNTSVRKLTNRRYKGGPYRTYATNTGPCSVRRGVARVLYRTVVRYHTNRWKMGQIACFGFKICILGVIVELFLLSCGPACVGSLSELAVANLIL